MLSVDDIAFLQFNNLSGLHIPDDLWDINKDLAFSQKGQVC